MPITWNKITRPFAILHTAYVASYAAYVAPSRPKSRRLGRVSETDQAYGFLHDSRIFAEAYIDDQGFFKMTDAILVITATWAVMVAVETNIELRA